MRRHKRRPFDETDVHDLAAQPVGSAPESPAYLDPAQSLAEVLASRDLIVLRCEMLVHDLVDRLDATWQAHHRRSVEDLREHTVGFVSHFLGAHLRDLAGQADSPAHARAVQAAVGAAEQVGEQRLRELPLLVTRRSLQEFFAPSQATSRFEDVGDEMAVAAVDSFVQALRQDVREPVADGSGTDDELGGLPSTRAEPDLPRPVRVESQRRRVRVDAVVPRPDPDRITRGEHEGARP
jgi:hypothetical protein